MEAKIQAFTDRLRDLLLYKNQNYGNSASSPPFLVPELTPRKAILVRISDKINRLQTLAGGEPDKVGESFDDTLFDLAGHISDPTFPTNCLYEENPNWKFIKNRVSRQSAINIDGHFTISVFHVPSVWRDPDWRFPVK